MREEKKYIIRYKMNNFHKWCYSINITNTSTYSCGNKDSENITKMILIEARKNVIKIKEIRKNKPSRITEIYVIDTETNKIIDITQKYTKFTRFEIMEI